MTGEFDSWGTPAKPDMLDQIDGIHDAYAHHCLMTVKLGSDRLEAATEGFAEPSSAELDTSEDS